MEIQTTTEHLDETEVRASPPILPKDAERIIAKGIEGKETKDVTPGCSGRNCSGSPTAFENIFSSAVAGAQLASFSCAKRVCAKTRRPRVCARTQPSKGNLPLGYFMTATGDGSREGSHETTIRANEHLRCVRVFAPN